MRGNRCWNCKRPLSTSQSRKPRRKPRPRLGASRPLPDRAPAPRPLTPNPPTRKPATPEADRRLADHMLALSRSPGQGSEERRLALQHAVFDGLTRTWRDCLLDYRLSEGRFRFPPWLVTLNEIRSDPSLRRSVIAAASALFPIESTKKFSARSTTPTPVSSLWPYHGHSYGDSVLQRDKHWRGQQLGSGPDVVQSAGHFPALAIAGHIQALGLSGFRLVPVPSRPMTADQPGQYSLRLANRVAELLGVEVADVLIREDSPSAMSCNTNGGGSPVVVVDDQLTFGTTMTKAIDLLQRHNHQVMAAFTWTHSAPDSTRAVTPCMFAQHLGGLAALKPCSCPTDSP